MAEGKKDHLWKYEASILEGSAFTSQLRAFRSETFPQRDGFKDEYLAYIPAAWTIINNMHNLNISASILWEMMKFSLLDYLVDEYMEATVVLLEPALRAEIKSWLHSTLLSDASSTSEVLSAIVSRKRPLSPDSSDENPRKGPPSPESDNDDHSTPQTNKKRCTTVNAIKNTLEKYINDIMSHISVRSASKYDRNLVQRELYYFLLAHMQQLDDNEKLAVGGGKHAMPTYHSSYYTWVPFHRVSTHLMSIIICIFQLPTQRIFDFKITTRLFPDRNPEIQGRRSYRPSFCA